MVLDGVGVMDCVELLVEKPDIIPYTLHFSLELCPQASNILRHMGHLL